MSESLRDQLLKAGFAPKPKQEARVRPPQRPQREKPTQHPPRREAPDIDLAKAYALRDKSERQAREHEQREAEQRAREKRERKQKLGALLGKAALNDVNADIARHFPHAKKIRRIYVTAGQLPQLNGGELAVVQYAGRYLLVRRETALAAQAIDADALVLLCDPNAADEDGVPADLIW
ncbi:MAG: DUF2058 family protein [Rhodanobacter sp.]|jgi:uncharacterized protein YaiL (DUF2058 family)|nr:DUF2058 family protein [Rhodanobacter sp.]